MGNLLPRLVGFAFLDVNAEKCVLQNPTTTCPTLIAKDLLRKIKGGENQIPEQLLGECQKRIASPRLSVKPFSKEEILEARVFLQG